MLDSSLGWILFPLGTALGWYLARRPPAARGIQAGSSPTLEGISTLANDDPDQAVAALLSAETLNEESVELHLTLGSLFRRRGQVDRALRVHEGLLTREGLTSQQRLRAEFELAEDYHRAGMLDRAERLYGGLADRGHKPIACLEALVSIHESSHDWPGAIEVNRRLESASGVSRRAVVAQCQCEMAEEAARTGRMPEAMALARKALGTDSGCARASLLLARLTAAQGNWPEAAEAYARAAEQEPRLLPEVVRPLWQCCRDWGRPEYFVQWMEDLPAEHRPGTADVVHAELLRETGLDADSYLLSAFERTPSWSVLEQIANLGSDSDVVQAQRSTVLREAVMTLAGERQKYQCQSCGMKPAQLFWHCPSCKQWGTVFPLGDRLQVRSSPMP